MKLFDDEIAEELRPYNIMKMVDHYNAFNHHGREITIKRDEVDGFLVMYLDGEEITTGVPEIGWRVAGLCSAIGWTH